MSELLSYSHILKDIQNFKQSGTSHGHDFNIYDTPSQKYFKLLFYFGSAPELYATDYSSGLLAPTWELFKATDLTPEGNAAETNIDFYNYNSAWAYLKMNNEEERAEKLEHFVTLLSDINTYSPWYFSAVGGLAEALERKPTEDGKMEFQEGKKLSINCIPDAFDNRITTLLDLYRDITWSWVHKREVIPANLRKFDMAVYIFEAPNRYWHRDTDVISSENNKFNLSYKMIEFHDCEFCYNSIKSGWGEVNNENGFDPKYVIDISYSDCYEISYNDIMMRKIGDVILTDLLNNANESQYESKAQVNSYEQQTELTNRMKPVFEELSEEEKQNKKTKTYYFGNINERQGKIASPDIVMMDKQFDYKPGFLENAVGQVAGHFIKDVKSLFTKAILGNIHTYSLTQIGSQLSEAAKGNLIKAGMTVAQYVKQAQQRKDMETPKIPDGNIYPDRDNDNTTSNPTGDIFPEPEDTTKVKPAGQIHPTITTKKIKPIGNIFSKKTLANNI